MSSDTTIEEIERKDRRSKLYQQWQEYIDSLEEESKDDHFDIYASHTVQKMQMLIHHLVGQNDREFAMSLVDYLREHDIVNLTNAHKPGWKQLTPLFIQIIGGVAAGVLGIIPGVKGFTGAKAQGYQSASTATSQVLCNGAQGVGQIIHTQQQGEQGKINQQIQDTQRRLGDKDDAQRRARQNQEETNRTIHQIQQQLTDTKKAVLQ